MLLGVRGTSFELFMKVEARDALIRDKLRDEAFVEVSLRIYIYI